MSFDLYRFTKTDHQEDKNFTGLHYNIAGWKALLGWLEQHGVNTDEFPRGCSGGGEVLSEATCAKVANTIADFRSSYAEVFKWKYCDKLPAVMNDVSREWSQQRDFPNDDIRWRQPQGIICH